MIRNPFEPKTPQAKHAKARQFDRNIRSWERAKTPKDKK
jgi:hypothetical protein